MKNFKKYCSVHLTYILFCCSLFLFWEDLHIFTFMSSVKIWKDICLSVIFFTFLWACGKLKRSKVDVAKPQ